MQMAVLNSLMLRLLAQQALGSRHLFSLSVSLFSGFNFKVMLKSEEMFK
jgi:hypothetical protein